MYEVVIVEDDPMVAMINRQFVEQDPHFRVEAVCKNGDDALSYLRRHPVALTVLDVYMPGTDGLKLLRRIRAEKLQTGVIMVTAANDRETFEEALRLGIVDYLVKPFVSGRFQAALDRFLAQRSALEGKGVLDQQSIDSIMEHARQNPEQEYPKGIQGKTLEAIRGCLRQTEEERTSEEIADRVGLSRVTVRRYMNYLLEKGEIAGRMNYETGGRPCMVYRWNRQRGSHEEKRGTCGGSGVCAGCR